VFQCHFTAVHTDCLHRLTYSACCSTSRLRRKISASSFTRYLHTYTQTICIYIHIYAYKHIYIYLYGIQRHTCMSIDSTHQESVCCTHTSKKYEHIFIFVNTRVNIYLYLTPMKTQSTARTHTLTIYMHIHMYV